MTSPSLVDDLGHAVDLPAECRRVVCLVPSLTEALASVHPERVVGATDWCTHPADLATTRVRGTKNPDLAAVTALRPDVVIANQEENRELDVRRLRAAGTRVWVTRIESVPQALASMTRLFAALGWAAPAWLSHAGDLWSGPAPVHPVDVVVPIWRDPWMAVGRDTFTGDLLCRVGLRNALEHDAERYPHVDVAGLESSGAGAVLLPDEPYVFSPTDGPEAFTLPTVLVEGRLLTWYGPSLVPAHAALTTLATQLGAH